MSLGEATITGVAGGSVTLRLSADTALLRTLGPAARIDVAVGVSGTTTVQGIPLDSLTHGVVAFRFSGGTPRAPDTVRLAYTLPRVFGEVRPLEPARLTQHLPPGATLLAWSTPWAPRATGLLASMSAASAVACTIGAPGTVCGISVGIQPFAPATV